MPRFSVQAARADFTVFLVRDLQQYPWQLDVSSDEAVQGLHLYHIPVYQESAGKGSRDLVNLTPQRITTVAGYQEVSREHPRDIFRPTSQGASEIWIGMVPIKQQGEHDDFQFYTTEGEHNPAEAPVSRVVLTNRADGLAQCYIQGEDVLFGFFLDMGTATYSTVMDEGSSLLRGAFTNPLYDARPAGFFNSMGTEYLDVQPVPQGGQHRQKQATLARDPFTYGTLPGASTPMRQKRHWAAKILVGRKMERILTPGHPPQETTMLRRHVGLPLKYLLDTTVAAAWLVVPTEFLWHLANARDGAVIAAEHGINLANLLTSTALPSRVLGEIAKGVVVVASAAHDTASSPWMFGLACTAGTVYFIVHSGLVISTCKQRRRYCGEVEGRARSVWNALVFDEAGRFRGDWAVLGTRAVLIGVLRLGVNFFQEMSLALTHNRPSQDCLNGTSTAPVRDTRPACQAEKGDEVIADAAKQFAGDARTALGVTIALGFAMLLYMLLVWCRPTAGASAATTFRYG